MSDKISCPTLNVVLVKAIRALCEVTIRFDHSLEITGSLHIRSDGDKVLTCLLNEDCIKAPSTPHINDIAHKVNLANAALALNNINIHNNQNVTKTIDENESLGAYNQQNVKQQVLFNNDSTFNVVPFQMNNNANKFNSNPNNIANSNLLNNTLASSLPFFNDSINKVADNKTTMKQIKSTRYSSKKKKVETVARTLANIKNGNNGISNDFNQIDPSLKLPDIQTLAHRLPSFDMVTATESFSLNSNNVFNNVALNNDNSINANSNNDFNNKNINNFTKNNLNTINILNNTNLQQQTIKKEVDSEDSKKDIKLFDAQQFQQLQQVQNTQQQPQGKGQGGRVKKFQCMFCGIFLSTKCYLKNHVNAMHTRLHVYKCDQCEHSFYSAGAMRIHKLRNHWTDSKKHKCPECNESFLLPIELRKHIQKRHNGAVLTSNGNAKSTTNSITTAAKTMNTNVVNADFITVDRNNNGNVVLISKSNDSTTNTLNNNIQPTQNQLLAYTKIKENTNLSFIQNTLNNNQALKGSNGIFFIQNNNLIQSTENLTGAPNVLATTSSIEVAHANIPLMHDVNNNISKMSNPNINLNELPFVTEDRSPNESSSKRGAMNLSVTSSSSPQPSSSIRVDGDTIDFSFNNHHVVSRDNDTENKSAVNEGNNQDSHGSIVGSYVTSTNDTYHENADENKDTAKNAISSS